MLSNTKRKSRYLIKNNEIVKIKINYINITVYIQLYNVIFLLHQIKYDIQPNNFKLILNKKEINTPVISKTLCIYLNKTKKNISKYITQWDNIKKYTNHRIYTYYYTSNKLFISKMKPISRAF